MKNSAITTPQTRLEFLMIVQRMWLSAAGLGYGRRVMADFDRLCASLTAEVEARSFVMPVSGANDPEGYAEFFETTMRHKPMAANDAK